MLKPSPGDSIRRNTLNKHSTGVLESAFPNRGHSLISLDTHGRWAQYEETQVESDEQVTALVLSTGIQ